MALSVLPRCSGFHTLCPRVIKHQLRPLVAALCTSSRLNVELQTPGKSHILVPSTDPLQEITLGKMAERSAKLYGDRNVLVSVFENKRITYAELLEQADRVAAGLYSLGLKRGDRVALWGPNSADWLICKFGIVRAGMILVTLNPAYQPPELKYALSIVGAKAVICAPQFKILDFPGILNKVVPELKSSRPGEIRSQELPDLRVAIVMSDENLQGFLRLEDTKTLSSQAGLQEIGLLQDQLSPRDVCEIQYTSGTTGNPKGCMLTHYAMTNNAIRAGKEYVKPVLDEPMQVLVAIPFFHVYASVLGIISSMYYGRTVVLASPLYALDEFMAALHKEKVEMIMTAPTILLDLGSALQKGATAPDSLMYVVTGGGMASPELFRTFRTYLPNAFFGQGYGMTETAPVLTLLPVGSTEEQQANTVGTFLPDTEAKVVDDKGEVVPLGKPGELLVRGYMTTPGYWQDEAKTAELLEKDGWLHTGDLFKIREDGYAAIIGRVKDMIVRGGENVFPKEIENTIETHPDVLEALVFGVADERLDEEVACVVRLRQGTMTHDDLKSFLKDKLAYFKIPRYFKVVAEVPRTAAGKPKKFELRKTMEEEIKKSLLKKS